MRLNLVVVIFRVLRSKHEHFVHVCVCVCMRATDLQNSVSLWFADHNLFVIIQAFVCYFNGCIWLMSLISFIRPSSWTLTISLQHFISSFSFNWTQLETACKLCDIIFVFLLVCCLSRIVYLRSAQRCSAHQMTNTSVSTYKDVH